ncbi:hypothetical protein N7481_010045 [Penicillium waksmanii]|uniref:uncharacterized protein n=1 Tax=Penicillium waksmanii TaxID=69791 RepID=UPI00254790C6|nr:uncharacterized protein N7481_010045 [Penicillium waksmanii]KAJ5976338.1 hypothetical protein N7481_010045 [Penicillium waksmanii]
MPKKGGKKKNKGGAKAPVAAAVDKVADTAKNIVHPGHESENAETNTAQTDAPTTVSQPDAAADVKKTDAVADAATPAATTTNATESESNKIEEKVAPAVAGKVEEPKAEAEEKAVLPGSTVKETSHGADIYPSTSEAAAEESATSTVAATGAAAPISSLTERPKTAESATVAPAAAEPVAAAVPSESDAAHTKRPYEKPIFSNDEVKPHKIAKTEEEKAAASAAAEKQILTGAGPASTAAYTAPEPVPVPETKKVEEKPTEKQVEKQPTLIQPPATQAPIPKTSTATDKQPASPDAVAAANAAINTSKTDKSAAQAPVVADEPKKPEAAFKRGEEPATEAPKTEAKESAQEPAKANEETKADQATEQQQPEKKKGGFFGWLKRKFK